MTAAKRTFVEFAIAIAAVVAIQADAYDGQIRINVSTGQGYDGEIYHAVAQQLLDGERPRGTSRFVRRLGTPFLAGLVDPEDLVNGFLIVNVVATVISAILLLIWFRTWLRSPWLRVGLVVLYALHWLQLLRFTFFYPVLVDAWTQVACFAGLNCIAWYERKPGGWPVVAVSVISLIGVFFREVALLIPLAFLFARNPRIEHLFGFPYLLVKNLPRPTQWIPLGLAWAALAWIGDFVMPTDAGFSASEHLESRAFGRNPFTYLLGWLMAFGPALFVVLFDWRSTVEFFARHKAVLVYTLGVAAIGWAGSLESERHALNYASPIVYVLLGRTIERHPGWFTSRPLAGVLLAAQALVSRVLVPIPQPDGDYRAQIPPLLLTPIGENVSYLHLFADYIPRRMAWIQFAEYVLLGVVIFVWMSRRAYLHPADGPPRTSP